MDQIKAELDSTKGSTKEIKDQFKERETSLLKRIGQLEDEIRKRQEAVTGSTFSDLYGSILHGTTLGELARIRIIPETKKCDACGKEYEIPKRVFTSAGAASICPECKSK
jgi:Zn finger protein HypA/HybF involved in hydrogenase expression